MYHPQTNGQVERFNRTILAGFRAFVADHPRYWHEYVSALAYAYNTQVSRMTGEQPFDLVMDSSRWIHGWTPGTLSLSDWRRRGS